MHTILVMHYKLLGSYNKGTEQNDERTFVEFTMMFFFITFSKYFFLSVNFTWQL